MTSEKPLLEAQGNRAAILSDTRVNVCVLRDLSRRTPARYPPLSASVQLPLDLSAPSKEHRDGRDD